MVKGCHENPKNLVLAHNIAATGIKHGYLEESRPLVEHGLRYATNEKARIAFSKFNSQLPEKAPATTEVPPDNAPPDSLTPANASPAMNTSADTTPPPPSGG